MIQRMVLSYSIIVQIAREELNFKVITGREMLVIPFDRNMVKATQSNVFVKNLGPSFTNKILYDLFKDFGEIFSVRLAQDYKGASKGYGYIQYCNVEDANKAISEMNGKEIEGRELIVSLYKVGEHRNLDPQQFTNIFVKNLPSGIVNDEGLKKLFERYGEITSVGIFSQEFKGTIGYYGFINFSQPDSATNAVEEMNNKQIGDSILYVTKALTKDQREREKIRRKIELRNQSRKFTLHVKAVKSEPLSDILIHQELDPYGAISSIAIQKTKNPDGTEVNTAIGYVVFSQPDEAEKAAKEYRKDGPIVVNLLEGKEQRREKMKQMFSAGRFDYGSIAPFAMRGLENPMRMGNRMQRGGGRGRNRGMGGSRGPPRMGMRPMMPGPGMPGRIPMPMIPGAFPNFIPGGMFPVMPQMGAMPGGMPPGARPDMMKPEMIGKLQGMPRFQQPMPGNIMGPPIIGPNMMPPSMMQPNMPLPNMPLPNMPLPNMIPPNMMPPNMIPPNMMMPQPMVQPQAVTKDELGENLYRKITDFVGTQ